MSVTNLLEFLRPKVGSFGEHRVMVADDGDIKAGRCEAYHVHGLQVDEEDGEICVLFTCPDPPSDKVQTMDLATFFKALEPLALVHPKFRVVARLKTSIRVGSVVYSCCDMPLMSVVGLPDQGLLIVAVDGLATMRDG